MENYRVYYKEKGGAFLKVQVMMNVCPKSVESYMSPTFCFFVQLG
jgi:hypothetical protein